MAKKKIEPQTQPQDDGREKLFRVECLDAIHCNVVRACMVASIGNLTLGFVHNKYEDEGEALQSAKENCQHMVAYIVSREIVTNFSLVYSHCNFLVEVNDINFENDPSLWKLYSKDVIWDQEVKLLNEAKEFWKGVEYDKHPSLRDPKNPQFSVNISLLQLFSKRLSLSTTDIEDISLTAEAIAMLGKSEFVRPEHLAEAIQYTKKNQLKDKEFFNGK